jgi:guanyl-specific ribonuclease Sa
VLVSIESYIQNIDATSLNLVSLKLKTDSIYKRMYQDSVNLAKLGTGVTTTLDSTTQRSTIKISNFPATQPVSLSGNVNTTISGVTKKALGTQVVSADTGLVVNAVMHGLTTGGGGGYVDVKVNPSGALTVDATQSGTWNVNNTASASDSSKYRSTIKVSNFPATQAVSGTVSIDAGSIVPLPLDAATETTLNQIATDLHYGKGASSTGVKGGMVLGEVSYSAPAPLDSTLLPLSINSKGAQRVVIMNGTNEITTFAGATTIYDSTYTAVQMDTAGLGAMANSATVGWQSDSVGLRQWKCTDVKIGVKISMANTAPANDKAVYVYVYPMWYDGSSTWYFTSGGTITFPSGANSTYTIASPNNLRLLGVLSYTTTNMVLQDQFVLSNAFGSTMPDAFGLVIVDFSGAAIHTTNHRIYYSLINKVQR